MLANHADKADELALLGRAMNDASMSELFHQKMLAHHKHFQKLDDTFNETRSEDALRGWKVLYPYFLSLGEAIERNMALAATVANAAGTDPLATSASNVIDSYDQDDASANAARTTNRNHPNAGPASKPKVSVEISNLDLNAVAPLLRQHGLMLVPSNQNNRVNNYTRGGGNNQQRPQGQYQAGGRKPPAPPANRDNYTGKNNGGYNRGGGNRNNANQGRGRANVAHDFDDAFDEAITDAVIAADDAAYYTGIQDEDAEDGEI
jgi:hypothetical protein